MPRPVIPPAQPVDLKSPTTRAYSLIQSKLNTAEAETASLVKQLTDLGFPTDSTATTTTTIKPKAAAGTILDHPAVGPVAPFLPTGVTADAGVLHKHYEALVTRLCRTESQLQALKLNLCALQAEKDLNARRLSSLESDETLSRLREQHEDERLRLNKEIAKAVSDRRGAVDDRNLAEEEMQRLASTLDVTASEKTELTLAYNELTSNWQKLNKRHNELKQELLRESSLRSHLEDYHATLLGRVGDMEDIVERERQEVQMLYADCSELRKEGLLIQEEKARSMSQQARLEDAIKTLQADLVTKDAKLNDALREATTLRATLDDVRVENVALQTELEKAPKEPGNEEVNHAADDKLGEELAKAKLEMSRLDHDNRALGEENHRLKERIRAVDQQEDAQQKVQSTISDLLESRNGLAYDKGKLQNRVDQLEAELETMAGARTEAVQLQKVNAAVQAKFDKTSNELSSTKVILQRLESRLRQEQDLSARKEKDFNLALQARDKTLAECQRLKGQIEVIEDREKQKAHGFQRSLADAKSDQTRIARTLEGVVTSHRQLQTSVEALQTELGRKDNELITLRAERQSRQRNMDAMQREVHKLQEQLVTMEMQEGTQVDSVRSDLNQALEEKTRLSGKIDELLQANGTLEAAVERAQNQLDKRAHKYKLLQTSRDKDRSDHQRQLRAAADRLQSLQKELTAKGETSVRNAAKELAHLRRARDELTSRVEGLTSAKAKLEARAAASEEVQGQQRDRISSLKVQLEGLQRLRRSNKEMTEKMTDISRQLTEMETAKRDYARRNAEQAKTIADFVSQVAGLQAELTALGARQENRSQTARNNGCDVDEERMRQRKLEHLEAKVTSLQEEKADVEEKLHRTSNESLQISADLQEAHSWFRTRHDALQKELAEARRGQGLLEKANKNQQQQLMAERKKAAEQTQRARTMIRASQQALSSLAHEAEEDHNNSQSKMTSMADRLQAEKDHSAFTDRKLQKFMDSSSQYIEELALQLDHYRSHHVSH